MQVLGSLAFGFVVACGGAEAPPLGAAAPPPDGYGAELRVNARPDLGDPFAAGVPPVRTPTGAAPCEAKATVTAPRLAPNFVRSLSELDRSPPVLDHRGWEGTAAPPPYAAFEGAPELHGWWLAVADLDAFWWSMVVIRAPCGQAWVAWGRQAGPPSLPPDPSGFMDRGYGPALDATGGMDLALPTSEDAPGTWWVWVGTPKAEPGPLHVMAVTLPKVPRNPGLTP